MEIFNQKVYGVSNILVIFNDAIHTYEAPVTLSITCDNLMSKNNYSLAQIQQGISSSKEIVQNFVATFTSFENSICSIVEPYFDIYFAYFDWQFRISTLRIESLSGTVEKSYPNYSFKGYFEMSDCNIDFTKESMVDDYENFVKGLY